MRITKEQFADRWGITVETLDKRRARLKNFPPAERDGVRVYFDLDQIKAFEAVYAATRKRSLIGSARGTA